MSWYGGRLVAHEGVDEDVVLLRAGTEVPGRCQRVAADLLIEGVLGGYCVRVRLRSR